MPTIIGIFSPQEDQDQEGGQEQTAAGGENSFCRLFGSKKSHGGDYECFLFVLFDFFV